MEDPIEKEDREKFMKFCKEHCLGYDFTYERGCYQDTHTFQAYIIWRFAGNYKGR